MKKIFTAFLALAIGVAIIAPTQNAEAQVIYSNRCCDGSGTVRCIINPPGPVGGGCFCYAQGAGFIC
jgi:hypothetical protein